MNETNPCPQCGGITSHRVNCPWWKDMDVIHNDVHGNDFESKMDNFFTSKTKEKESGRKCSINLYGMWT